MKKYMTPEMEVMDMQLQTILCVSITTGEGDDPEIKDYDPTKPLD